MASTLVKSIRISPELWAFVETEAQERGTSPNAWVVELIEAERARERTEDDRAE